MPKAGLELSLQPDVLTITSNWLSRYMVLNVKSFRGIQFFSFICLVHQTLADASWRTSRGLIMLKSAHKSCFGTFKKMHAVYSGSPNCPTSFLHSIYLHKVISYLLSIDKEIAYNIIGNIVKVSSPYLPIANIYREALSLFKNQYLFLFSLATLRNGISFFSFASVCNKISRYNYLGSKAAPSIPFWYKTVAKKNLIHTRFTHKTTGKMYISLSI